MNTTKNQHDSGDVVGYVNSIQHTPEETLEKKSATPTHTVRPRKPPPMVEQVNADHDGSSTNSSLSIETATPTKKKATPRQNINDGDQPRRTRDPATMDLLAAKNAIKRGRTAQELLTGAHAVAGFKTNGEEEDGHTHNDTLERRQNEEADVLGDKNGIHVVDGEDAKALENSGVESCKTNTAGATEPEKKKADSNGGGDEILVAAKLVGEDDKEIAEATVIDLEKMIASSQQPHRQNNRRWLLIFIFLIVFVGAIVGGVTTSAKIKAREEQETNGEEENIEQREECFVAPGISFPNCTCHESCATCGYYANPVYEVDCITCPVGVPITPLYDDGTGLCGRNSTCLFLAEDLQDCISDESCTDCPAVDQDVECDALQGDLCELKSCCRGCAKKSEKFVQCVAERNAGCIFDETKCERKEEKGCFVSPGVALPDCSCHESCETCGYLTNPIGEEDCITCPIGATINPVYNDGTGSCVPKPTTRH